MPGAADSGGVEPGSVGDHHAAGASRWGFGVGALQDPQHAGSAEVAFLGEGVGAVPGVVGVEAQRAGGVVDDALAAGVDDPVVDEFGAEPLQEVGENVVGGGERGLGGVEVEAGRVDPAVVAGEAVGEDVFVRVVGGGDVEAGAAGVLVTMVAAALSPKSAL